jgi:hypothetical protein
LVPISPSGHENSEINGGSYFKCIKNVEFIETDQVIAFKALKIVNSAYYAMSGKIVSIQLAAIVLGYKILVGNCYFSRNQRCFG